MKTFAEEYAENFKKEQLEKLNINLISFCHSARFFMPQFKEKMTIEQVFNMINKNTK